LLIGQTGCSRGVDGSDVRLVATSLHGGQVFEVGHFLEVTVEFSDFGNVVNATGLPVVCSSARLDLQHRRGKQEQGNEKRFKHFEMKTFK
jgi:hypothetical protein